MLLKIRIIVLIASCLHLSILRSQNDFTNQESFLLEEYIRGSNTILGGSGVSVADFNQDGLDDITLASKESEDLIFYQNTGNGFNKINPPFVSNRELTKCIMWVDFDNDGDKDLYVTSFFEHNKLYQNDGNMIFTDVTATVNLPLVKNHSSGANFGDIDFDGYLDLHVTNYYEVGNIPFGGLNELYKYDPTTGSYIKMNVDSSQLDQSFCSTFFDYDNDNDLDLYVANDRFGGNKLYKNRGNGIFADVSDLTNAGIDIHAMNTGVGDYNNDGFWDIYVTNTKTHPSGYNRSVLLQNNGDESFSDVSVIAGTTLGRIGWGASFFDVDNDMDQDLYVSCMNLSNESPNALFINSNQGTFSEPYRFTGGMSEVDTFLSFNHAVIDADNNGSLDIFNPHYSNSPVYLHMNTKEHGNNFFKLDLIGTLSNKDAYGAIVIVEIDNVEYKYYKFSTNAFLSQGSDYLNIGIGNNNAIDRLTIRWPYSGSVESFVGENILIGAMNRIIEGSNTVSSISLSHCLIDYDIKMNPISSNLYQASNSVTAHSQVSIGSNVNFRAENFIQLNHGFEVSEHTTFLASILNCN